MSDKPEKIYAYPGSLIYSLKPALPHTVEYIRADLARPSEWISVETELPEEQQQVLVVGRDRRRRVQLIQWWRGDQDDYSYWKAITPLPPPPTRETP